MMNLLQTWLLITVMALSANGAVNAKVALGGINLSQEVHWGLDVSKPLNALGISEVSATRTISSPLVPNEGVTLTAKFKDGLDPKEFDRKVNRVRNKIDNGEAFTNIPHNVTNAERSALTRKYRKDVIKRINSLYKNNPQARENALKRLRNSDIDHIQDLQAGGQNVRKNLKALDSQVNQELGRQFSRQIPKDVNKPITKIEVEGKPEP